MTSKSPRKFTIADGMILVAATAVGFLLLRVYQGIKAPPNSGSMHPYFWTYSTYVSPFLIACALGLLAVRAMPPRPTTLRILRQPGTVACVAALTQTIINEITIFARSFRYPFQFGPEMHVGLILRSGYSVGLAWMVIALARAWRPEVSWIDRAGRALGVILIVLWVSISIGL